MTAQELLERPNLLDENERIEAKSASEIGKSLLESVCAFANEPGLGGGSLLLGVEPDDAALFPSYEVCGIEQPDKLSAGLLQQNGRGSATRYQPTARMLGDGAGLSSNPGALSSNPEALSSNPGALSSNPRSLSSNPDPAAEAARRALLNELPGELAARIGGLGRRHPPEEIREVVVALCRHRDYRAEELAQLLSRNVETVRQNYLRPLLHAGRIAMTRPDKPNDPEQAYRVVEEGR